MVLSGSEYLSFCLPRAPFLLEGFVNVGDTLLQSYLFILINLSVAGQTVAAKITSLPMEINLMTLVAVPTSKDTVCVCVCVTLMAIEL